MHWIITLIQGGSHTTRIVWNCSLSFRRIGSPVGTSVLPLAMGFSFTKKKKDFEVKNKPDCILRYLFLKLFVGRSSQIPTILRINGAQIELSLPPVLLNQGYRSIIQNLINQYDNLEIYLHRSLIVVKRLIGISGNPIRSEQIKKTSNEWARKFLPNSPTELAINDALLFEYMGGELWRQADYFEPYISITIVNFDKLCHILGKESTPSLDASNNAAQVVLPYSRK